MPCGAWVSSNAEFSCPCDKKFMTADELKSHQDSQTASAKESKCSRCCRSFNKDGDLHNHQRSKSHWQPGERKKAEEDTGRVFCDDTCGRSFGSKEAWQQHRDHFRAKAGMENVCHGCTKTFIEPNRLDQHQRDTGHKVAPGKPANNYIDKFMKEKKVHVDPSDKQRSVEKVKSVLDPVMREVRKLDGGEIFSADVRKAGSHAMKAKIGKADEFDTNIPVDVKVKDIQTRGPLPYKFEDKIKPNKVGIK